MKTFRNLILTLNGYEPEAFIKKLETQSATDWFRDLELEKKLSATTYCFLSTEKLSLPIALLGLREQEPGVLSVTNIIPRQKSALSYDEYNALLLSFYEELVVPAIKNTSIRVEITSDEIKIADFVPEKAANALQVFSSNTRKSTDFFIPVNEPDWFEFVTAIHQSKKRLPTNIFE